MYQQQWRRSGERKDRTKFSFLPNLVENQFGSQSFRFVKFSFPVMHFMPYYAETGRSRSRPLIVKLSGLTLISPGFNCQKLDFLWIEINCFLHQLARIKACLKIIIDDHHFFWAPYQQQVAKLNEYSPMCYPIRCLLWPWYQIWSVKFRVNVQVLVIWT